MSAGRAAIVATFAAVGWLTSATLVSGSASACMVSPGQSGCAPDSLSVGPGATQVGATQTGTVTSTGCSPASTCIVYTYTERVYRDPSNAINSACAAAHNCLDWVVQITNQASSGDTIGRVTLSNFQGFLTDMGTTASAPGFTPAASPQNPATVGRNNPGSAINWVYPSPNNEIAAGQTSALMEAETNATQVVPGNISIIDGSTSTVPALGPALPEAFVPALGVLGFAIVGGFAFRRRRRLSPPGPRSGT